MRTRLARPAGALLAAAVTLGPILGCGPDTARNFGFTRDPPDEFQVTTRAPLSMPPSLGELPTPRPGATRPQELSQRQAAEATLVPGAALGGPGLGSARPTAGESALLSQAGRPVGDDIRRRVDEESLRLEQTDRALVDRLMFWREPPPPGIQVDAQREAQRLRENAALGREATDGQTPIVQPPPAQNPASRLWQGLIGTGGLLNPSR